MTLDTGLLPTGKHYKVMVAVETFKEEHGRLVKIGDEWQARCGCTQALQNDFGHERVSGDAFPA